MDVADMRIRLNPAGFWRYFFLALFLLPWSPPLSHAQPSVVSVSGTRLMVAKRQSDGSLSPSVPYTIKGVAWAPSTRAPAAGLDVFNGNQEVSYGFFINRSDLLAYWNRQEFISRYQADIPLIKQMNANTVRVFYDFDTDPNTIKIILDLFYDNGIMVIMVAAGGKWDIDDNRYSQIVSLYKDHPAILMWSLGNEWNFNNFGYSSMEEAIAAINPVIAAIKAADPNHPVSSSLGEGLGDWNYIVPLVPGVDLWGLNIYRGASFGTLFAQWQSVTTKPLYLSEFGTDSFQTTQYTNPSGLLAQVQAGSENRMTQASFNAGLWKEINNNLSAVNPALNCAGGTVFGFNDQLWKVGNSWVGLGGLVNYNGPDNIPSTADDDHSYNSYNPDGFALPGAHPDNVSNEEYFGLVTADRVKKPAFGTMKHYYSNLAPQVNAGQNRTVALSQPAFLNGTWVDDGLPVSFLTFTWSKTGYTGSGSGNVSFSDPNSLQTTATFSDLGTYELTLTADDGILQGSSNITLNVAASVPLGISGVNASPNPVTGTQTALSVAFSGGTAPFSYVWSQPGNATLDNVNTPAPQATFAKAGAYSFTVIVQDALGYSADSSVTVPVNQTVSSIEITPPSVLWLNQTYSFTASELDQFGDPMSAQASFAWSVTPSAGASIDSSGQFVATSPGPYTVQAQADGVTGQSLVYAKGPLPTSSIRTFYTDVGTLGDAVAACDNTPVCTWSAGGSASFNGNSTTLSPPEGKSSFMSTHTSWAGWGIFFNPGNRDFSAYNNGQLRFWIYTNNANMKVDLEHTGGSKNTWSLSSLIGSKLNQWVPIAISLSGITLNDLYSPFEITTNSAATFYVDNVRYVDPTVISSAFNVNLYNVVDNQPAGAINFSNVQAGQGWTLADQYIQLEVDSTLLGWGVQIYTDNSAADADPKFAGPSGANPAGLVDSASKIYSLPMAWSIKANGMDAPVAADPDNMADTESFQWLFMKDINTPDIPALKTTAFTNGDYYVTARSNKGIQFAGATSKVGAENPPNQIYLEANFKDASTPNTYKTTKLHLEFYQQ